MVASLLRVSDDLGYRVTHNVSLRFVVQDVFVLLPKLLNNWASEEQREAVFPQRPLDLGDVLELGPDRDGQYT